MAFHACKTGTVEGVSERRKSAKTEEENPRGDSIENERTLLVQFSQSCQSSLTI
jgi:hypothetical protein